MVKNRRVSPFKASSATAPFNPPKGGGNSLVKKMKAPPGQSTGVNPTSNVLYSPTNCGTSELPILKKPKMEEKLVKHIISRLQLSDIERQARVMRATDIDRQVSGYIRLDKDDRKRMRSNKAGNAPKPVKHNLPLTQAQLDEAETYLMGVFAPDMDIFTASASADKQAVASGLTAEINAQGQRVGYYRQFSKTMKNALKYNLAAITVSWEQQMGYTFEPTGAGQIQKKIGVVWEGNLLESVDIYNFFYDTSVHPIDLPLRGEYFAVAKRVTPFRALKMQNDGMLFGCDRFIDDDGKCVEGSIENTFYETPPTIRDDVGGEVMQHGTNWQAAFQEVGMSNAPKSELSVELVPYVTWIIPKEFGLSDSTELELWRVIMAQGRYIAFALRLDDTHGMLPIGVTTPIEDDLNNDQRTYAEQLMPLQHFASFLMNTHQDATRKSLYGITVFDPRVIPLKDLSPEDLISAILPMRSSAAELDIDKAFRRYNDAPTTDSNVDMVEKLNQLMQKILPTDSLRQVADLERATLYQAAATVQAGNRRMLKIARLISDQCFTNLKTLMMYNIYSNIKQIDYIDQTSGATTTISPADLIAAKLELDVGTGLKGIDKLMQLQIWQTILNSCLQSQQAFTEIDIVKLLSYIASLAGDRTDVAQFKRTQPAPASPDATMSAATAAAGA